MELLQGNSGELLYNIGALLSLSAYIMSNVLWLRILLVIAASLYVTAGLVLGITSMSGWNAAYLVINLYHVVLLLMNHSTVFLDDEVKGLYLGPFSSLTSREFKKLIKMNPYRVVSQTAGDNQLANKLIIKEGQTTDELLVILRGKASVTLADKQIAQLAEGDMIGEMSFISKTPASADVTAEENTILAYWSHQDLDKLKRRNHELYNKFIGIIGIDLVTKLKRKNLESLA